MADSNEALLQALREAIQAEVEGQHFYLMAAQATDDDKGHEVFLWLAEEEQRHADYLRAQLRALSETGRIDPNASLGDPVELEGDSPIFSESFKQRARDAHFEMTALSVGAQLEKDAQAFYKAQADKASDPEVREFLLELARWESGHYHALLAQQKALRQAYFAANDFAPF